MVSDTVSIAFAAPIALDVSQHLQLAYMVSWLDFSTRRVRFDSALAPVAAGMYPIEFGAVNNRSAVPNALDTSQCLWFAQMAIRAISSTWCVRSVDALVTDASRAFWVILEIAWYDCFVVRLLWLLSRSTWRVLSSSLLRAFTDLY